MKSYGCGVGRHWNISAAVVKLYFERRRELPASLLKVRKGKDVKFQRPPSTAEKKR